MSDFDVLIIGGGPVGLWTATQIKKANPELKVAVLERYTEYKRSHILRLEQESLSGNPAIQQELRPKPKRTKVPTLSTSVIPIATQKLEQCLLRHAQEAKVQIIYEEVKSTQALAESYPDSKIIIAADGSHSSTRQQLFGEDKKALDKEELQYMVELRYEVTADTQPLDILDATRTRKLLNFYCHEHVTKGENGRSKVSLRFFVDKATYEALGEASLKKPRKLSDAMPDKLKQDINIWMNARKKVCREEYIAGSSKVTKTTLSVYASKQLFQYKDGKLWLLVGDAAFGVPYFRSLNNGLLCGSELATAVVDALKAGDSERLKRLGEGYQQFSKALYKRELRRAKTKNFAVNFAGKFLWLSGQSPSEVNYWEDLEEAELRKTHTAFQESTLLDEKNSETPLTPEGEFDYEDALFFGEIPGESPRIETSLSTLLSKPFWWNPAKKITWLGILLGTVIGVYLSVVLMPFILQALASAAMSYSMALFLTLMLSLALIASTVCLFAPMILLAESAVLVKAGKTKWIKILSAIALLAGLAFGVYLCTVLSPLIITVLLATTMNPIIATCISIVASLFIITITISLMLQLGLIRSTLKNIFNAWRKFKDLENHYKIPMLLFFIMGQAAGTALGIYFSIYLAPLAFQLLATLGIQHTLGVFIIIALAAAFTSGLLWLSGRVGLLLVGLTGALSMRSTPKSSSKVSPGLSPESTATPASEFNQKKASTVLQAMTDVAFPIVEELERVIDSRFIQI